MCLLKFSSTSNKHVAFISNKGVIPCSSGIGTVYFPFYAMGCFPILWSNNLPCCVCAQLLWRPSYASINGLCILFKPPSLLSCEFPVESTAFIKAAFYCPFFDMWCSNLFSRLSQEYLKFSLSIKNVHLLNLKPFRKECHSWI